VFDPLLLPALRAFSEFAAGMLPARERILRFRIEIGRLASWPCASIRQANCDSVFSSPMLQAIPASLPIAFGIVLATLPLMAVPLTLTSRGAIRVLV